MASIEGQIRNVAKGGGQGFDLRGICRGEFPAGISLHS
jgi:hypothetical protein